MAQGKKLEFDNEMMTMLAMIRQHQPPPSIDQLMAATGFKSTNTVNHRLEWLETEGYIEKEPGTRRTLVATEKGMAIFPEFMVMRVVKRRSGTEGRELHTNLSSPRERSGE